MEGSNYVPFRNRLTAALVVAMVLAAISIALAMPAHGVSPKARQADEFVDSIGINAHFGYGWTPYTRRPDTSYVDDPEYQATKHALAELGVRHIRSGAYINQDPDYFSPDVREGAFDRYRDLYESVGIKTDVWVYWSPTAQEIEQMKTWGGEAIESFEGTNEPDFENVCSGAPAPCDPEKEKRELGAEVRASQQDLYEAVKGNPSTAELPVIGPSIVGPDNVDHVLDPDGDGVRQSLAGYMDYGNIHSYMWALNPFSAGTNLETRRIPWATELAGGAPAVGKQLVSTETGYNNAMNDLRFGGPVPEDVAAKYTTRSLLDHFNRGFYRTYVYELHDWEADPERDEAQKNWSLLRSDGTRKPAYRALGNLIDLLQDPGPSFETAALDYSLSGETQNLRRTLLQKRDGSFYLVLWGEVSSYDTLDQRRIDVQPRKVSLSLGTPVSEAAVYLPNDSSEPVHRYSAPQRLTLNVPDHPMVVELEPSAETEPFPPQDMAPSVSALRPAPQSRIRDRTPPLRATVRGVQADLQKDNVALYVDGRRKSKFGYDPATGNLRYTTGQLSYGRHQAKIVASDAEGRTGSRLWRFKVVK